MTFKEQLAADVQSVFLNTDEFAVAGTYSGDSSTVDVILDYSADLAEVPPGQAANAIATLDATQVPTPTRYETLTIGGVVWRIDAVISGDGYTWMVSLSRDHRAYPSGGTG